MKKGITIAFANRKGGCGKSFTTYNVGTALSKLGYSVIIIDADSQCNISKTVFGDDSFKDDSNLYSLLQRNNPIDDCIYEVDENLMFIPSNPSLLFFNVESSEQEQLLKESLSSILDCFDFILIDTPPDINSITLNVFIASDYIVGVTESKGYSMDGLLELINNISIVQTSHNHHVELIGIVINKYKCRRFYEQRCINKLISRFDDLLFSSAIPDSAIVLNALENHFAKSTLI